MIASNNRNDATTDRTLTTLVRGLVTSLVVGTALFYALFYAAGVVSHALANRVAEPAYERWQSQIAIANLNGDTPQQVIAFLGRHGANYTPLGDLPTPGFVFADVGPVAASLESATTNPHIDSWYLQTSFQFDSKNRLVGTFTCVSE